MEGTRLNFANELCSDFKKRTQEIDPELLRPTITIYDGANTIGGNKIYVEEGGRDGFLDFGKYGKFDKGYLTNRTTRELRDLLHLRLIPELDINRSDLVPEEM